MQLGTLFPSSRASRGPDGVGSGRSTSFIGVGAQGARTGSVLAPFRAGRSGFTLLEIATALVIISILTAIGFSTLKSFIPRYRLIQASKELQEDLMSLRMSAIDQNSETRLLLTGADDDWSTAGAPSMGSWELQGGNRPLLSNRWDTYPLDLEGDGTDDAQGEGLVDIARGGIRSRRGVSLVPWGTLSGPGSGNDDSVVFSPRGWVTNPADDFDEDGYITLTLVNKIGLAEGVDDHVQVRISRAGMVRLQSSLGHDLGGGAAGTGSASTDGS